MNNAKQIRRINNALDNLSAKPACPSCNHKQVEDVLKAVRDAHEDELTPSPEPKPLKLEADARVLVNSHMYFDAPCTVISVHKSEPSAYSRVWWVSDRGSVNSTCEADITVVEAATPEVGDYVQLGWETTPKRYGIITKINVAHTNYKVDGICNVYPGLRRDDFTILHKAPKE